MSKITLLLFAILSATFTTTTAAAEKPNIVLIMADDTDIEGLGCLIFVAPVFVKRQLTRNEVDAYGNPVKQD